MKKFFVALMITLATLVSMNAADLTANEKNNVNNIVTARWKDMTNVNFVGIVNVAYNRANIESLKIEADGSLTIIGKMDVKGSQVDVYQINVFASNVTIKYTTKFDKKTNTSTVTKVMVVKTAVNQFKLL